MQEKLNALFRAPLKDYYTRRIVVWMDEDGEFSGTVGELRLENARVLVYERDRLFELRRQIEVDYAGENILLYCGERFARAQDNDLLDVFLYSEEFRADYWSLLFDELGIENTRPMRDYTRTVAKFFDSKERRGRLRQLRERYANEKELQTGIFCVLCGIRTPDMGLVIREVLRAPEDVNPLEAVDKICGPDAFWQAVEKDYGYQGPHEALPLAVHLLNTASLVHSAVPGLKGSQPHAAAAYQLFADWLRAEPDSLLDICQRAEAFGRVREKLEACDREALLRVQVYPAADQVLLASLLKAYAEGFFNTDDAETVLRTRADKPWNSLYAAYYAVVRALKDMQLFHLAHRGDLHFDSPETAWQNYRTELYRMDRFYRHFCSAYDQALSSGVMALEDDLKAAQEAAERLYKNWFLSDLNMAWTDCLTGQRLEEALPRAERQADFYAKHVAPQDSRVYVIISDALRYEVAQELTEQLNARLSGNAECSAVVGTIPTITPVGMAALLPHRQLRMDDALQIRCDDLPTDAQHRQAVLQARDVNSLAAGLSEFRQMTRSQRQEAIRNAKVVYLYHDVIDSAGESGGNVFAAAETAMDEIAQMTRVLVNELSAATIFITADHGFLCTRSPLDEYEKADREVVEGDVLEYKRRHAIVRNPRHDPRALFMPLTALGRDDLTGVFPRGSMRFRLQGGSSPFMHGGLSLQELMVPLISYQNKKTGQKGYTAITQANVILLGDNRKISNSIFTLVFFQKEPCSAKVQPRQVMVRFEDGNGQVVSDEHIIHAGSSSVENNDRTTRVTFHLLGSEFDRSEDYYLVMTNQADGKIMERIPFRIDVVFGLDFGF